MHLFSMCIIIFLKLIYKIKFDFPLSKQTFQKTPNRRSVSKNEKSPGTLKRRSSLKLRKSESKSILPDEDIKENVDKKRVSRKSVAFDGKRFF